MSGRGRPSWAGVSTAAGVAVLGLVAGVAVVAATYHREGARTLRYVGTLVTTIVVTGDVGDIRVRGIDTVLRPEVTVVRTTASALVPPQVSDRLADGTLTLEANCPPAAEVCRVDYAITVAVGTQVLRLRSTHGDIVVSDVRADVDAVAETGGVTVDDVAARNVSVSATGDVQVSCVNAPTKIRLGSGRGAVRLRLPATTAYDVDALSVRGPVDVRVGRESGSPHRVMVRSTDGPVTVTN